MTALSANDGLTYPGKVTAPQIHANAVGQNTNDVGDQDELERHDRWATSISAVQMPPSKCQNGGRVEHFIVCQKGKVTEVVANQLHMPKWLAERLLQFGAIFACRVPPATPPQVRARMSPERVQYFEQRRQRAIAAAGNTPGIDIARRCLTDVEVEADSFVRVHCQPKRFPAAYKYDWMERVVAETHRLVVVNKPPCVPAAPVVDNMLESVPAFTGTAIGYGGPLLITSRLDHCTEGLLMLAKDTAFATLYNHLQKSLNASGDPCVKKHYRAVSLKPPPTGRLVHYLRTNQKPAGGGPLFSLVQSGNNDGGKLSELIIHRVEEVGLCGGAAERWGPVAYESWIELKTGRTHQIRAQLAECGAPLCGDTLYQSLAKPVGVGDGSEPKLEAPTEAIGLQCAQLEVCNLDFEGPWNQAHKHEPISWQTFRAGCPWWRPE